MEARIDSCELFLYGEVQLVVRCDLLPLAALIGISLLFKGQLRLQDGLAWGAAAAAVSLAISVSVDSALWGRWTWPEGEVLWFNTAENRSASALGRLSSHA